MKDYAKARKKRRAQQTPQIRRQTSIQQKCTQIRNEQKDTSTDEVAPTDEADEDSKDKRKLDQEFYSEWFQDNIDWEALEQEIEQV